MVTDTDQKVAGLKPGCGFNVQSLHVLGFRWDFQTKIMHVRLKVLIANEIKHKNV